MANFAPPVFEGNSIFRNQPHHSYFDKPFEDPHDCLYQFLHEIDPYFLTPEQQADKIQFLNITIRDPRTQTPITQLCYDYTQDERTKVFNSPKRSIMAEKQHELGLRVLNNLQQFLEVEEEDMYNWYRLQKIRAKENQYFQNFVYQFHQGNKEQMYAPCRRNLKLYQKWYKNKVVKLMKRYSQETYNTHLGLPQVRQCKNVLVNQQVEITNQELVAKIGEACCWQENFSKELKKLNYSLEAYAEHYENSEDLKDSLEDDLHSRFLKIVEQDLHECPLIYLPLESLLFLLTAGDYVDVPTEMLLNIKERGSLESDFNKYVVMDIPLPSRQAGWHSYQEVVEQAAIGMLSLKQSEKVEDFKYKKTLNNPTEFRVSTWQDFMQKTKFTADKLCKFSKCLLKWQLTPIEDDIPFHLYTSMNSPTENKSHFLKLEYKPRFGCELLTKYEILREWFKLKILDNSKTYCLRLDATNYQTLLEEPVSTRKLEEKLRLIYKINCQQLLNNLFEFLKMLYKMPTGHYMLRYNPKFKDKLMLCKPSQEITQNTINLHQLLNTEVHNIEFMSEEKFLAIDENLCNLMHLDHQILPASFCPRATVTENIAYNKQTLASKQKTAVVEHPKKESKKPIVNKSKKKRARRRERLFAAMKAERNEQRELEKEMELDRKMLNI